jgi:hypothetical protein
LHPCSAPPAVFDAPDVSDRKAWALPAATGSYQGLDLSLLDRDDEDERRYLIEAEHPGSPTHYARASNSTSAVNR